MNLLQTLMFVRAAHGDQTDKNGELYYNHVTRVMRKLGNDAPLALKQVALLHDVVEDTHVSLDDLVAAGFADNVIVAVHVLTRDHSLTYGQYIYKIIASQNQMALRVKLADLTDNLDPKRSAGTTESLTRRYRSAYLQIQAALNQKEQTI